MNEEERQKCLSHRVLFFCVMPMRKMNKKKKPSARKVQAAKTAQGAKGATAAKQSSAGRTDPKRVAAILAKLDEAYPAATSELKHENAFQLLISTILSAQCTDVRVNIVTATLFPKYPNPKAFAFADSGELE